MYSRGMKAYCFSIPVMGMGDTLDEAFSYAVDALLEDPMNSIHNQEVTWEAIGDDEARVAALIPLMAKAWPHLPPRS